VKEVVWALKEETRLRREVKKEGVVKEVTVQAREKKMMEIRMISMFQLS